MTADQISPALLAAVRQVTVAPDRLSAVVGTRDIQADDPPELRRMLADAFYEILHAGQDTHDRRFPLRIRDEEFERVLDQAVPHRETVAPAVVCAAERETEAGRQLLVELAGVRVWMPLDRIRHAERKLAAGDVVTVTTTSRRPALSPGFFLVDGARPRRSGNVLRVYVHIADWDGSPEIWGRVLTHLEREQVAYRAKVLSSKHLYPRQDALVVYLDSEFRQAAKSVADLVRGMAGVGSGTSLFAERLAPGVAMAWEPGDRRPGMDALSFGQHRASVLAQVLVDTSGEEDTLIAAIRSSFIEANIDPGDPSRNLDSPAS
ncbi:hypothetical protein GCM10023259_064630 [Thermocatellispora tengchongensis]